MELGRGASRRGVRGRASRDAPRWSGGPRPSGRGARTPRPPVRVSGSGVEQGSSRSRSPTSAGSALGETSGGTRHRYPPNRWKFWPNRGQHVEFRATSGQSWPKKRLGLDHCVRTTSVGPGVKIGFGVRPRVGPSSTLIGSCPDSVPNVSRSARKGSNCDDVGQIPLGVSAWGQSTQGASTDPARCVFFWDNHGGGNTIRRVTNLAQHARHGIGNTGLRVRAPRTSRRIRRRRTQMLRRVGAIGIA